MCQRVDVDWMSTKRKHSEVSCETIPALEQLKKISETVRSQLKKDSDETLPSDGQLLDLREPDYADFKPRCLPPLPITKNFMQEHYAARGFRFFYTCLDYEIDEGNQKLALNMFGYTDDSWSSDDAELKHARSYNMPVMVRIWGFQPYFLLRKMPHWAESDIVRLLAELDRILIEQYPFTYRDKLAFASAFQMSGWVSHYETIMGKAIPRYRGDEEQAFIKVYVQHPRMVAACRYILENPGGKVIDRDSLWKDEAAFKKQKKDELEDGEDDDAYNPLDDDGLRSEAEIQRDRVKRKERLQRKRDDARALKELFVANYGAAGIPKGKFLPSARDLTMMTEEDERELSRLYSYVYYPRSETLEYLFTPVGADSKDNNSYFAPTERIFEADVEFKNRFIIDNRWTASSWYLVPLDKCILVTKEKAKLSRNCPIELVVQDYRNLSLDRSPESQFEVPNFVQAATDDEMSTPNKKFPQAQTDPILQKSIVFSLSANPDTVYAHVFTVGDIAHTSPHQYVSHCFADERQMLKASYEFFAYIDTDIFLGWNTNTFDWPYELKRGEKLGLHNTVRRTLSRHRLKEIYQPPERTVKGKRVGVCNVPGRINIDCMKIVQMMHYPDNSLNYAANRILKRMKESFNVYLINMLQQTAEGREKIAEYVMWDSLLPLQIFVKLKSLLANLQVSKLALIPVQDVYDRAQGAKIGSKLRQELLDNVERGQSRYIKTVRQRGYNKKKKKDRYEGATVLDPIRDFYENYVLVLDFASMYPTIIRAFNICYTTLISRADIIRLGLIEGKHYWQVPNFIERDGKTYIVPDPEGFCFLRKEIKEGILPRMERELGAERSRIRKEQRKYEEGSFMYDLLDGQQLGIKVWMNSVYGLSGDTTSEWFQVELASTITKMGRWMISTIKTETERHFRREPAEMTPPPDPTRTQELLDRYWSEHQPADDDPMDIDDLDRYHVPPPPSRVCDSNSNGSGTTPTFLVSWEECKKGPKAYEARLQAYRDAHPKGNYVFAQETFPFAAQVVYGDSVVGSTPILCRANGTDIQLTCIDELAVSNPWYAYHGEGKEASDCSNLEVWTEQGFTPIRRVIRHRTSKTLYRVRTDVGHVTVTEDHSLLDESARKLTPKDVRVGSRLLCSELPVPPKDGTHTITERDAFELGLAHSVDVAGVPREILNGSEAARTQFLHACMTRNGSTHLTALTEIAAAGLFYVASSLGYQTSVDFMWDTYRISCRQPGSTEHNDKNVVTSIESLGEQSFEPLVYDLETENHHFSAGVGQLIVHNTDSIMVNLDELDPDDEYHQSAEYADEIGLYMSIFLDLFVFAHLWPIHLEYEKKYAKRSYNLMNRKNYCGCLLQPGKKIGDDKTYLDVKGLGWKKNDRCPFEKVLGKTVSEMISVSGDIDGARKFAVEQLALIRSGSVPIYDVTLRQQLSKPLKEYGISVKRDEETDELIYNKTSVGAAVILARKKVEETGEKIGPGSIMNWVICDIDFEKKAAKPALQRDANKHNTKPTRGMQAVDPVDALDQGLRYDAEFYFDRCLKAMWKLFRGPEKEPWVHYKSKNPDKPYSDTQIQEKNYKASLVAGTARRFLDEPSIRDAGFKRPKTAPINKTSALFQFLVPRKLCANSACAAPCAKFTNPVVPLCDACLTMKDAIYTKERAKYEVYRETRDEIYSTCFGCLKTKDIERVKMCSNTSCPNFLARSEAQVRLGPVREHCVKMGMTIPEW